MEQQDQENTHRVGAQRSLNSGEFINLKSSEQAENLLLYGDEEGWIKANYPAAKPLKSYRNFAVEAKQIEKK